MMLRHLFLVALLSVAALLRAQGYADAHVREGDRHFQQMAYARAVAEYQAAADMGAMNEHVTRRLAESYMRLSNTEQAERWYATVVKFMNREPEDLFHYAEALKSNGRYTEAEEWMDRYLALVGDQRQGGGRSNITGFARKFSEGEPQAVVATVSINTPYTEMATAWLGQGRVLFASSRNETIGIERRAAWNNEPFLDLFVADVSVGSDLVNARPLQGSVNSRFHEGPATASASGDEIWFTRNNFHGGRVRRSQQGITRLGIFRARGDGTTYGEVEPFLFNNAEVSMGHPALSPDGRKLYFVSDMPGGHGGSDIYVCRLQDGQWGEPENLGPRINTTRSESFPYIGADGTLYFASNGHAGLGGMDIFAARPAPDGGFMAPINVGVPINGPKDEFALIIDASGQRGYFTSNRPGGKGGDDIYAFTLLAPLEQRFLVTGKVFDDEYEVPVMAAEVKLYDMNGALLGTTTTDPRGEYGFPVDKNKAYRLVAMMKGRYPAEQHVSTERIEVDQIVTRDLHLVTDAGVWMQGTVRHKDRLGFIPGMTVSVVNLSSFFSEAVTTGEGGDFRMRLQTNEDFEVLFEKAGFFSQSVPVTTMGMKQGIIDLNEARDLAFEPIEIGTAIPLKHIRWAEGEAKLDPIARTELDGLVERMLVNPGVMVEIAVHGDVRGDTTEIQRWTQRRADGIVEYLREKGVPTARLTARGYGATRPVNACASGAPCTEEQHAANRRNEYIITSVRP